MVGRDTHGTLGFVAARQWPTHLASVSSLWIIEPSSLLCPPLPKSTTHSPASESREVQTTWCLSGSPGKPPGWSMVLGVALGRTLHIGLGLLPHQLSSVQLLSHVRLFVTPWTAACQASLSITNSQSLLKLMSIESVMPSNHLILCQPLLLPPSVFPSIRVFSNKSVLCIRWPKCWSFSFSFSLSNEYPGLISFRMDWLDLLAVQGTLKSLLQHHISKVSILHCSAFFIVQLSHPYMTTGKTIALTR